MRRVAPSLLPGGIPSLRPWMPARDVVGVHHTVPGCTPAARHRAGYAADLRPSEGTVREAQSRLGAWVGATPLRRVLSGCPGERQLCAEMLRLSDNNWVTIGCASV